MNVREKLSALRSEMSKRGISAYIIPTDDFHGSEYVGDFFKARAYMSGFTGSAGTLVVLPDKAAQWVDGRYFLQAASQLEGSTIELMKMGEPGVPEIPEFLFNELDEGAAVGFDGRTISASFGKTLKAGLDAKSISYKGDEDLVDLVWKDRPGLSKEKVWKLSDDICGESRKDKLSRVRAKMAEQGSEVLVVCALDEVAWLMNLRGGDVECTPVFLAYMIITENEARLYANSEIFSAQIAAELCEDGIEILPYFGFNEDVAALCSGKKVWADAAKTNFRVMNTLDAAESVFTEANPIELMKAMKNPAEQRGEISAHIKDGAAVTEFMYWIKKNVGKMAVTELSAADELFKMRSKQDGFIGNSFSPIVGYAQHGAIVHYGPTPESDCEIKPEGLLLVDTGGHYVDGSTDITRTFAMGKLTDEEKRNFTLVLKGHLNLANAKFKYGVCGQNLDYLAREPLWKYGMDYNHGTGHGVGFILGVHEGPHRIHWNFRNAKLVPFEEGMIVSDEPGVYITGKHGVRHENLLLCKAGEKNEYGQFMYFQNLTMVPFDKDAIDLSLMSETDVERLNAYHALVWENISPFFEGEMLDWLREATAPVSK